MSQSLRANLHMDERVTIRVLNGIFISKEYRILENKTKILFQNLLFLKVHMNRKFFLCRYKLSPLKYTISKFETFGVKIGDVTGV